MLNKYIVIIQSAWCNDRGCGISYYSSLEKHDTREKAINDGWSFQGSDDFNIGVIRGGRLVSLDGTEKEGFETDPYILGCIAEKIGLNGGDHA